MGVGVTITRGDHTATELRSRAGKCDDAAQVRRLLALALVLEGRSRSEAAAQNGMDRQTLRDWVHRYNTAGIEGLKSRHSPGRAPALTEEQMAELRALVVNGPDPLEHKVVRWRCLDLQAEVARRFAVEVHESTIGKWLRQLRLTRLQPRPFHPKKVITSPCCYRARDHRSLDGDLQAGGDRRRTRSRAGAQRRMAAVRLSCLARNGRKPRGRKSIRPPLRLRRSRRSRSSPDQARKRRGGFARRIKSSGEDVADVNGLVQEVRLCGRRKRNAGVEKGGLQCRSDRERRPHDEPSCSCLSKESPST